ncbi:hypothetical protein [Endozoicomonas atrinae]|nr:hypothetical protein [Endozoicomonas atrinae]
MDRSLFLISPMVSLALAKWVIADKSQVDHRKYQNNTTIPS